MAFVLANFITIVAFAQSKTITGNVMNSANNEKVAAVSVTIKGSGTGTFTDDKGAFRLNTNQKFPITLLFTSVGYEMQEVTVTDASQAVSVSFKASNSLGQEAATTTS